MKRSILITGGAGLLAVNWAAQTRDHYHVTLCLHKRSIQLNGTTCRFVDLNSVETIAAVIREINASVVVHAAAMTSVEECEAAPQAAHHANVVTASNVAQACKLRDVKLVHISTDHLFSGTGSMMSEQAEIAPKNVYAQTKAAGEVAVFEACPSAIVVRTNFFGWGLPYRKSFSDGILAALTCHRKIDLFCDVYFTPILMAHLISATHALIDNNAEGIFHITGDERLSKYDFGLNLAYAFRLDPNLIRPTALLSREDLVQRPLDLSLSNKKMRDLLPFELPEMSINSQLSLLSRQPRLQLNGGS
jgi:dTDP-4-dehydrorhamnose reductase